MLRTGRLVSERHTVGYDILNIPSGAATVIEATAPEIEATKSTPRHPIHQPSRQYIESAASGLLCPQVAEE